MLLQHSVGTGDSHGDDCAGIGDQQIISYIPSGKYISQMLDSGLPVHSTDHFQQMTSEEVTGGLALPYGAMAIAGKGGAVATLLMTFMSVTSTLSAQVIAVSSIISFDVYKTYWNYNASGANLIRWSQIGVVMFGLIAAGLTAVFNHIGLDMGWTLYMIGKCGFKSLLICE